MENKIIVFANQKGGVGKTTLCTLFANYLASKKEKVCVIDCDVQQTIFEKRLMDKKKFKNTQLPYIVQSFNISDTKDVEVLMQNAKKLDSIVLFDAPGNIAQDGLLPIFRDADYIVCPYQYEVTSINSTVTFVKLIYKMKSLFEKMKAQIFFVPNKHDKRIGKKSELELWQKTDNSLTDYGFVTPRIDYRACIQRYNTFEILSEQGDTVNPSFNFIYKTIKQL